jgi:hypothetical protein
MPSGTRQNPANGASSVHTALAREVAMSPLNRQARVAGLLYVLLALVAPLRLMVIPSTLFVTGNAGATAANIAAHESLFRWGMAADAFVGATLVFVVLALYRLLSGVHRPAAVVMLITGGIVPATIYFLNIANDAAALLLIRGAPYLDVFDKPQRDALAFLFLRVHGQVVYAAETLWGVWLIPLAMLVFHSGFLPRLFGVWLLLNGLAYIAQSFVGLVLPQYSDSLETVCFPLQMGEIAFMLWLLLFGARRHLFRKELHA